MDWQKANIAIKKINALQKSMSMGQGSITSIERDLMLNYIRQLYELFLLQEVEEVEGVKIEKAESLSFPNTPAFEIVENEVEEEEEESHPAPAEPPKPKKPAPPKIIEIPESLKNLEEKEAKNQSDIPAYEKPAPPKVEPKVEPRIIAPPSVAPKPKEEFIKPASYNKADLEGLFDFRKGGELADKLSEQPLKDLTKALSINDRLLYMNQLFGKDMSELDESLKLLNRFESLPDAKSLIYNLAEQYNWTSEEKVNIAKDFLRLIRRRYL